MKLAKLAAIIWLCSTAPVFYLPIHCQGPGRPATTAPTSPRAEVSAAECPQPPTPPASFRGPAHPVLLGFSGDTAWIHAREGHVGRAYWPDGISGVTLDPGIDLGHAEPWLIEVAYRQNLSRRQWRAVRRAMGVRGPQAAAELQASRTLRSIRISRARAASVFPYLLKPYWKELRRRFPALEELPVPPTVQTALLSLAYNRGAWNPDLAALEKPLQDRDWATAAEIIRAMQQDHVLDGIRRRRRVEGLLISSSLAEIDSQMCVALEPRAALK